jgi:hypothetical protein
MLGHGERGTVYMYELRCTNTIRLDYVHLLACSELFAIHWWVRHMPRLILASIVTGMSGHLTQDTLHTVVEAQESTSKVDM